jgi:hypothetical protein
MNRERIIFRNEENINGYETIADLQHVYDSAIP